MNEKFADDIEQIEEPKHCLSVVNTPGDEYDWNPKHVDDQDHEVVREQKDENCIPQD
jgi:hypothetical protein